MTKSTIETKTHNMANQQSYDYEQFDIPYNQILERTDSIPSSGIEPGYGNDIVDSPVGLGENVIDGQSIGNFYIQNWIKSANYKPKVQGFLIHGQLGYIECMQLYVGSGGIVGGSLDIPDKITPNSFHVAADGTTWWGANWAAGYALAPAYVLPTGEAAFTNVTIHGRDGQALADAINADADLITDVINDRLDTQAEEILGDYTFGGVGSIAMANDANNGIWLSPSGILGKKAGLPTFTITTSGDATFAGELAAAYGTFGTITAGTLKGSLIIGDGTTTAVTIGGSINATGQFISDLVNSKINTSSQEILKDFDFGAVDYAGAVKTGDIAWNSSGVYIGGQGVAIYRGGIVGADGSDVTFSIDTSGNAYFAGSIGSGTSISAPTITGGTVTGALISGGTVRAGTYTSSYMELGDVSGQPYLRGFVSAARRVQLDNNSLEFFDSGSDKMMEQTETGLNFYWPAWSTSTVFANVFSDAGFLRIGNFGGNLFELHAWHNSSIGSDSSILIASVDQNGGTHQTIANLEYLVPENLALLQMNGVNSRIESNRITVDTHVNFGSSTSGDSGYGIRQSGGTMQYKDNAGIWTAFSAGGGVTSITAGTNLTATPSNPITSTGTISHTTGNSYYHLPFGTTTYEMLYHQGSGIGAWTSNVYVGGSSSYYLYLSSSRIRTSVDFVASGSLHATGNVYTGGVSGASGSVNCATININGNINFDSTSRRLVFGGYSYGPKAVVISGTTYYLLAQY